MGILKKKWKTVWEGPELFDPTGGDGHYVLQENVKSGKYRAFFKNDNSDIPIELKDLRGMYTEVEKILRFDYWE